MNGGALYSDLRWLLIYLTLALPAIFSVALAFKRVDGCGAWLVSLLISAAGCYFLTFAANYCYESHLEAELSGHDTNGDGYFFDEELSPEAQREVDQLMTDLGSDTGRTFAPCTGLVIWPIYAAFWHGVIGGAYLGARFLRESSSDEPSDIP